MNLFRSLAIACGVGLLGVAISTNADMRGAPVAVPVNPVVNNCNTTQPGPVTPALLRSGLPCAAQIVKPFTLDNIQHGFDFYSWLTFLALNAPAGTNQPIGKGAMPGGDAPADWEHWKEISDVMLAGGEQPGQWNSPRVIPKACQGLSGPGRDKVVRMVGKTPDLLAETNQPFDTGPLIDQNGSYVRYEILVNKPMYEYILQNHLYSKAGQASFTQLVDFPAGKDINKQQRQGTVGGIMVKAAWKVLGPNDKVTDFHTANALLYTPPVPEQGIAESCVKGTLGLVGLHVAHKTANDPQWLWSTFEHKANAPSDDDVAAGRLLAKYNFYDAKCPASKCAVNEPPPRPWNPNIQPFPNDFHSQITRVIPITEDVARMNRDFQGLLANTVWQNYELVSTQWPANATSKTDPTGDPAPVFLANTTMETYIQGRVPLSSSSCMACHGNATTTAGRTSDFTFILERAK